MASLTVREKEHWKERIARKIDEVTDAMLAKSNPSYSDEVYHKAKQMAIESLGIASHHQRWTNLYFTEQEMQTQRGLLGGEMLTIACGVAPENARLGSCYSIPLQVTDVIKRRTAVYEKELMAEDELGRKILELQQQKEELLDTVWLATSSKQIKLLWEKIGEFIGLAHPSVQEDASKTDPVENK